MEIAYSDEQRILLTGNYGTGKTFVAFKKLEFLYEDLNTRIISMEKNFVKYNTNSQKNLQNLQKNSKIDPRCFDRNIYLY